MTESLSWGHPLAWAVYVLGGLNLLVAGALFWVRQQVLVPQRDELLVQAAEVQLQLSDANKQLVQVNRQFDRGLDQFEQALNLIQGLFLALIETRLVETAMLRLRHKPLVLKLAIKQGLGVAFARAENLVRTHHIKDRDEASLHEQPQP